MTALIDNDVLMKGACYLLLAELIAAKFGTDQVGYLGAAKFVLTKKIRIANLRGDTAEAEAELLRFLEVHQPIETTAEEQEFAANLETMAQNLAVNLDSGESQLLAVLVLRTLANLLTGDKRAILAIERLLDSVPTLAGIAGKVICLEQLVGHAVVSGDPVATRAAICREPGVDRTLSICFSCSGPGQSVASVMEGLVSYIADLRQGAPRALST